MADPQVAWIQTTIPSPSAALLAVVIQDALNDGRLGGQGEMSEVQYNMLANLRDYFQDAATNPRAFQPRETMANSLKVRARLSRGVRRNDGSPKDGTPSAKGRNRKNRRAKRQARAASRRAARRASVSAHNQQRDEQERATHAAAGFIQGHVG